MAAYILIQGLIIGQFCRLFVMTLGVGGGGSCIGDDLLDGRVDFI